MQFPDTTTTDEAKHNWNINLPPPAFDNNLMHSSFPQEDFYFNPTLSLFFGKDLAESDFMIKQVLGSTGYNIVIDKYRMALMTLLKAEGFKSFHEASQKHNLNMEFDFSKHN